MNAVFEMVSPENLVREVGGPGLRGVAAGLHHALQRHDVLEPGHSGCEVELQTKVKRRFAKISTSQRRPP